MAGELRKYTVTINGRETTLRLSDADAEAQGLKVDEEADKSAEKKTRRPVNKQRPAANK